MEIVYNFQEIILSAIMQIKSCTENTGADGDPVRSPPIFEIHVGVDMVYFVGEDPTWGGSKDNIVTSAESGVGLEQAMCWESAIRKALMPVTPQPSTDVDKGFTEHRNRSHIFYLTVIRVFFYLKKFVLS